MKKFKKTLSFLLTLCLVLNLVCMGALAASAVEITDKPANGTTTGQPFAAGTANSANFRIPGIVTLNSGRIVASIDARWSWIYDAGGIDTLVAVSDDNGANWEYTFANYLGDNGNVANNQSSCFIDPAIGTDGTTAYMIADLYPAGFAINSAAYAAQSGSTGFDADGNLLLRSDSEQGLTFGAGGYETGAKNAAYDYYLADGKICTTEGTVVEGYTVDAYFNIKGNGVDTNLFFSDSPYKPFPTDFLYMTKSTDGLNWSEPELLNVKAAEEQSYLVGPGNGTYDAASGRMIFTAYRHTGGASGTDYECTSLIWMDSAGNWKRSEDCTVNNWSSEASCVVLDDGTVRVFYRDGYSNLRYTDMVWDAGQQNYVCDPDATEVSTSAAKTPGCQLTAIKYSKQIDGKDAIIVATPANSGSRADGHIYVFLVNDDKSMELVYNYDITPNNNEYYAYSCLTELDNGDLGLLWESASSAITYSTISMKDVTARENNINLSFVNVDIYTGETFSYEDTTGNYEGADVSELITQVADVKIEGTTEVNNAAQTLGTGAAVPLEDCLFTFTASGDYYVISKELSDGTTVYLNHFATTHNNIPLTTGSNTVAVTASSAYAGMFKLVSQNNNGSSDSSRSLHFHMESTSPVWNRCGTDNGEVCHEYLYRPVKAGETASEEIPGYVRITTVEEIEDGGKYLIAAKNNAGNWYVLNPSTSSNTLEYVAKVLGESSVSTSKITFTGVGAGKTAVQIGNVVYYINVTELINKNVSIDVDGTAKYTDDTGYYVGADTSDLVTSIATVSMTGTVTDYSKSVAEPATAIKNGRKYLIVNTRAGKPMTNAASSAAAAAGAGSGLSLSGSTDNVADIAIWTIEGADGTYTVKDAAGKYLTIGDKAASVSDTAANLSIAPNGDTWTISQGDAYLNHFGGSNSTCAAGWKDDSAAGDDGSQWKIYEVIYTPADGTTEITFTGVAPGETSVQIGDVLYKITVGNSRVVSLVVDDTAEYTDDTGDYTEADTSALDSNIASVELEPVSKTVYVAGIGSDTTYSASTVALANCLYTFSYDEATGYWTVSSTDTSGNAVYLYPGNTVSSGYPNRTDAYSRLSLMAGSEENTFSIMSNDCDNTNQNTSYLYFDRTNLRWDRVSSPEGNDTWLANTSMRLYRAAAEGEESSTEIPGYVRVTALADVTDGQYLIAAPGSDNGFYMLYPSVDSSTRYSQIAKVTTTEVSSTKITFTAIGTGKTSVQIGDVTYSITVTDKVTSFVVDQTELPAEGGEIHVTIIGNKLTDGIDVKAGELSAKTSGTATEQTATLTIPANTTKEEVSYTVQYSLDGTNYIGELIVKVAPVVAEVTKFEANKTELPAEGGDITVTITGTYLENGIDVKAGNVTAKTSGTATEQTATLTIPANTTKEEVSYTVQYSLDGTNYIGELTVKVAPVVAEVTKFEANKTELPAQGGDITVTITGTYLDNGIDVKAGNATGKTSGTATEQTATLTIPANETEEAVTYTIQYSLDGKAYTGEIVVTVAAAEKKDPEPSEPDVTVPTDPKPSEPVEEPECPKDETCVLAQFSDIDPDSCWYHDGVHYCVETGLMKGQGNNSFAPDAFTTRAELVMILYRQAGSPSLDGLTEPFTDVADDAWYYAPIVWAYNNGVVNGTSDTTFAPNDYVTREQVATILYRYLESPDGTGDLSVFPDGDTVSDYAKEAMAWAVGEGLINGVKQQDGTSLLDPLGNAKRAQIATILMRYLTGE